MSVAATLLRNDDFRALLEQPREKAQRPAQTPRRGGEGQAAKKPAKTRKPKPVEEAPPEDEGPQYRSACMLSS